MNAWARWLRQSAPPTGRRRRLELQLLEERTSPTDVFRSIDGTNNNLLHPTWGGAGVDLIRVAPAAYTDGVSAPAGADRPSARVVSNVIADQGDADVISTRQLSAMAYAWGQFLDHDLDLTPSASPAVPFNVPVPAGDPSFDPAGTGTQVIPLNRSLSDPATGTGAANPRQQVNTVTAFVDGSQVYGSDAVTADKLRTHVGGKLKVGVGADGRAGTKDDTLPLNNAANFPTGTLPMANDAHVAPDGQLFAAGDVRANENIELTSLQTIFVREHNRIADAVARANPRLSDEQIYQQARAQVIGEMQAITYNEWLPALLGPNALPAYRGYNPSVNPGIANEFSTAAFRLGHSMLGDDVEFLGNNGHEVADPVALSQAFFNPTLFTANGADPILKYLSSDPSSEVDSTVVESVRNFLFGPPGSGGLDLASLNIRRGRDHGLADYNSIRAAYGLPEVTSFAQITSNVAVQQKLQQLYGSVNNIDAWVGMLAEDHVRGGGAPGAAGSTGPTIRAVLVDQFTRLRDGDRFWYQRAFSGAALNAIQHTTLADVIRRNTSLTNLQSNVFFFRAQVGGTVFADANRNGRPDRGERALAGRTVTLIDAEGDVVATAVTDSRGSYLFTVADGLRTGLYTVRVDVAAGQVQTTRAAAAIPVTRGDVSLRVDLGVASSSAVAAADQAADPLGWDGDLTD
ncbi:MAG TPA: peroxidase family protein, partial [Gemmataceae bacterium]